MLGPRRRDGPLAVSTKAAVNSSRKLACRSRSRSSEAPAATRRKAATPPTASPPADAKPEAAGGKEAKEFAWMDSDDDDEEKDTGAASRSASPARLVPMEDVQTLGEMSQHAPQLERRLEDRDLDARELVKVAAAIARSKFFDAGLMEKLADEVRHVCKKRQLNVADTISILCCYADLNAPAPEMFEAACKMLHPEVSGLAESDRQRLDAALKRVGHSVDDAFASALRKRGRDADRREACPMFWRGQCKWGPKCKLSHDPDAFEGSVKEGNWRPPSMSGGKSVGYKQSADLFKADRCGALW